MSIRSCLEYTIVALMFGMWSVVRCNGVKRFVLLDLKEDQIVIYLSTTLHLTKRKVT